MYANGRGVPLDYVEAYKWLSLATLQNWGIAVGLRKSLAGIMTKRQLDAAAVRIAEWNQQHPGVGHNTVKRRIVFESPYANPQ
jgi:hypothetical protein